MKGFAKGIRYLNKIRSLKLHTRTGSIYVVANLLNPLVRDGKTTTVTLSKEI